jgi:hypothetical protein
VAKASPTCLNRARWLRKSGCDLRVTKRQALFLRAFFSPIFSLTIEEIHMVRIVQNGTTIPVEVVYAGGRFQVWKLPDKYTVFYQTINIDITEPELSEMAQDLQELDAEIFEVKWILIFDEFLDSL